MKKTVAMMVCLLAALAFNMPAQGQVSYYEGTSQIVVLLGDATFDGLQTGDPLQNYQEDGLTLDVDDSMWEMYPPGFPPDWFPPYYPNGGVYEMITITRTDGADFDVLEMYVSNGWGSMTTYLWIRAFLDGGLVDEFDSDVTSGTLVGLTGQFDEVHVASYYDAATRDLHDPAEYDAIALDNVAFGTGEQQGDCGDGYCGDDEDCESCPQDCCPEEIPTVSEWGLIVLTLLLLTTGTMIFARRRRPAVA